MENRVFLVTGATNGIGKQTALLLAKAGGTVLVHGRDPERLDATVADLKKTTGNANIRAYLADFASLADVRKLSEDLHASEKHIDVLINNAGVFQPSRIESKDGYEMTFAVNVLAPFLLTNLLLDLLKEGHKSRIINVSSVSQANFLDLKNMQLKQGYGDGHKAYSQSKLCGVMITLDMAERLKPAGITVNCLDPGTVNTQMLLKGWGEIGDPVDEADNEFHLATDEKYDGITGNYYVDNEASQVMGIVSDKQLRRRLWKKLAEMTGAAWD